MSRKPTVVYGQRKRRQRERTLELDLELEAQQGKRYIKLASENALRLTGGARRAAIRGIPHPDEPEENIYARAMILYWNMYADPNSDLILCGSIYRDVDMALPLSYGRIKKWEPVLIDSEGDGKIQWPDRIDYAGYTIPLPTYESRREDEDEGREYNEISADVVGRPYPPVHERVIDINHLWSMGLSNMGVSEQGEGFVREPNWALRRVFPSFGSAWTCFTFILSDMRGSSANLVYNAGQATYGGAALFGWDILAMVNAMIDGLLDIAQDPSDGQVIITPQSNCIITLEGYMEVDGHWRLFPIVISGPANTIEHYRDREAGGEVIYSIVELMAKSDSLANMLFHTCNIHVITNLAQAGSLANMPDSMKRLRSGRDYALCKGFITIDDSVDNDCGLDAVIMALANSLARLKKIYKAKGKQIPKICDKFTNFRRKFKSNNSKAKATAMEYKLKLAGHLGWEKGKPISPLKLAEGFFKFASEEKLDLGLLIFNAITPHSNIIVSYNPVQHVPLEKLCLVHWDYEEGNGHYDCIDTVNLTTWMQKGTHNRKELKFSFKRLSLVANREADEKGELCELCLHFEQDTDAAMWRLGHRGSQGINKLECKDCGVRFRSMECVNKHRLKRHGLAKTACSRQFICPKCKLLHQRAFDCDMWFCQICFDKMDRSLRATHVCFIKHGSTKKSKKILDVIYSDMEGSRKKGYHEAVNVASCWSEVCDEHKQIFQENKCDNCKNNDSEWGMWCSECTRLYGECPDCSKKQYKLFDGENCLQLYLDWLIEHHMGSTIVFHNGGKYDLHLLYIELLSTGRFIIDKEAVRSTQIIFMKATLFEDERKKKKRMLRFIDSCNFLQTSLRNFSFIFDLKETLKGRFPYDLLNTDDWESYDGVCPSSALFGITDLELKHIDKLNKSRQEDIKDILDYITEFNKKIESGEEKSWNAKQKLEEYTLKDVEVLYDGCEIFRYNFWKIGGTDPFHWVTLPAAVAGTYRQPEFMLEKSIQLFNIRDREWQRKGLRGGRCEPTKLYWRAKHDKEELKIFDVNSEYPFVQAYGYYPIGAVTVDLQYKRAIPFFQACDEFYNKTGVQLWDVLKDPSGKTGCGLIECELEAANVMFPILPYKIKAEKYTKNMFMNRSGHWIGFITVLAEAIEHCQVIITNIYRIQFWKTTTDKLYQSYMCKLYAAKVEASGWDKILNKKNSSEEERLEFIKESKKRGIILDYKKIVDNPGQRSTAKVMNNSGWGYQCQKPKVDQSHYFNNETDDGVKGMETLLSDIYTNSDKQHMIGLPTKIGKFTKIRTTKDPLDITNKEINRNVAYHAAGQVPAYGLQLLSRNILKLDPEQVAYCDTDSIFFVVDEEKKALGKHKVLETGNFLGDFVDEYPTKRIVEFVCIGPKSYFLKMVDRKTGKEEFKGKFKGIPMCSSSFSLLDSNDDIAKVGMEDMKRILFSGVVNEDSLSMVFHYTNFFKRSRDMKIREVKEKKTIRFTYDKRRISLPDIKLEDCYEINTLPWNDKDDNELTSERIKDYWLDIEEKYKLYKKKWQTDRYSLSNKRLLH